MNRMSIPKLSLEQIEQINTAKKAASERLKNLRHELARQRKVLPRPEIVRLQNRLARLSSPRGKPVIVVMEGDEIRLDYELLSRFVKSFDRRRFSYWFRVHGSDFTRTLTLTYDKPMTGQRGMLELFELSTSRLELLQGLPRVEICN